MSGYSEAQIIQRSDLASSRALGESSHSPDLDPRFHAQLAEIYGSVASPANDEDKLPRQYDAEIATAESNDDTVDAYTFRLFANPSVAATKVVVRSPPPVDREAGFVNPHRRNNYYFTGRAGKELEERYRDTAIAGERILEESNIRWPGCELPWRVLSIKATNVRNALGNVATTETGSQKKRGRIGKKRRIAIRKRIAAAEEIKLRTQKAEAEKEVAEKEKRTRRNREKKVKKKQREKLKKSADLRIAPVVED